MGRRSPKLSVPKPTLHIKKRIFSNEDWYPTSAYKRKRDDTTERWDGMVTVHLIQWDDGRSRVAVWGGDDFGLEKEFENGDFQRARTHFHRIVDLTTQADLRNNGFYNA